MQMVGSGILKGTFFSHMSSFTKLINIMPIELAMEAPSMERLYNRSTHADVIKFLKKSSCLTEADNDAYNIVVLGPTGSGKSTIINHLFNQRVCLTGDTAQSVTREVTFLQGSMSYMFVDDRTQDIVSKTKKMNVIDTIGKRNSGAFYIYKGSLFLLNCKSS